MFHFVGDLHQDFVLPPSPKSREARGNFDTRGFLIFWESRCDKQVTLVEICLFETLQ